MVVAAITAPMFRTAQRTYGPKQLVWNLGVIVLCLLPFIFFDTNLVSPEHAAALARIAYLVFHIAFGFLVGGAISGWL